MGGFPTLQRAGLREMDLATLRPEEVVLNTKEPYIDVCERTVDGYEFIPKWYQERHVNIDSELAALLKKLKSACRIELVFGTKSGRRNLHLLRECKRIAVRAGLSPTRFKLHRFRANFATHCLRQGPDLETLREQMGHRDTESLRAYVNALKGEERAAKVAKVWACEGADQILGESQGIRSVRENISRVAGMNTTVLITGETGTGKELVARAIFAIAFE